MWSKINNWLTTDTTGFPYKDLWDCVNGEGLDVFLTVLSCSWVAIPYWIIAFIFWKASKKAPSGLVKTGLLQLMGIFVFCSFCGYVWHVLHVFWASYKLLWIANFILGTISILFIGKAYIVANELFQNIADLHKIKSKVNVSSLLGDGA